MARHAPNAILTQRMEVGPGLGIFRSAPDGWPLPELTPGQVHVERYG